MSTYDGYPVINTRPLVAVFYQYRFSTMQSVPFFRYRFHIMPGLLLAELPGLAVFQPRIEPDTILIDADTLSMGDMAIARTVPGACQAIITEFRGVYLPHTMAGSWFSNVPLGVLWFQCSSSLAAAVLLRHIQEQAQQVLSSKAPYSV